MRLVRDAKIDRLAQLPVFADCPLEELAAVAAVGEHLTVPRFREVTREGRTREAPRAVLGHVGDEPSAFQCGEQVVRAAARDGPAQAR